MQKKYYKAVSPEFIADKVIFNIGETVSVEPKNSYTYTFEYYSDVETLLDKFPIGKGFQYIEVVPDEKSLKQSTWGKTNSLKVERLVVVEELQEIVKKQEKEGIDNTFLIPAIVELCKANPTIIVGGSIGLFLHGVVLEREEVDVDIVLPYYSKLVVPKDNEVITDVGDGEFKSSGSDFSDTYYLFCDLGNGQGIKEIKMDVAVDPKQRYTVINYNGFDFKVVNMLTIIEAKLRYAMSGGKKHIDDFDFMLRNKKSENKGEGLFDLPY